MTYRKKLIEVTLPLDAINRESAREKSIRHGHPSTLHLWWARRPLAACRAVLFASLVDDPDSDPQFRWPDGTWDRDRAGVRRAELSNIIEELVRWKNSNNEKVLNRARAEIAASIASAKVHDTKEWSRHQMICGEQVWNFICRKAKTDSVNRFLIEHAPPVLDPFCGGGSIPLEAQRLGLRAFGSDLNPVPVLITKALIEIPPKFANMPPVNPESRGKYLETPLGARASLLGARASCPQNAPQSPIAWTSRGYLPHFDRPGLIQSVTFRLVDSVPTDVIEKWHRELKLAGDEPAADPRCAELR